MLDDIGGCSVRGRTSEADLAAWKAQCAARSGREQSRRSRGHARSMDVWSGLSAHPPHPPLTLDGVDDIAITFYDAEVEPPPQPKQGTYPQ